MVFIVIFIISLLVSFVMYCCIRINNLHQKYEPDERSTDAQDEEKPKNDDGLTGK
jgi:phosphotransferase system  glucose/maltose/N-acetylglucosamine-specific IIC component